MFDVIFPMQDNDMTYTPTNLWVRMNRGKSVNSQCRHLELKNFSHLQNQYIIVMGTLPFHESIYRSRNPEFGVYFKSEFILFFF